MKDHFPVRNSWLPPGLSELPDWVLCQTSGTPKNMMTTFTYAVIQNDGVVEKVAKNLPKKTEKLAYILKPCKVFTAFFYFATKCYRKRKENAMVAHLHNGGTIKVLQVPYLLNELLQLTAARCILIV